MSGTRGCPAYTETERDTETQRDRERERESSFALARTLRQPRPTTRTRETGVVWRSTGLHPFAAGISPPPPNNRCAATAAGNGVALGCSSRAPFSRTTGTVSTWPPRPCGIAVHERAPCASHALCRRLPAARSPSLSCIQAHVNWMGMQQVATTYGRRHLVHTAPTGSPLRHSAHLQDSTAMSRVHRRVRRH